MTKIFPPWLQRQIRPVVMVVSMLLVPAWAGACQKRKKSQPKFEVVEEDSPTGKAANAKQQGPKTPRPRAGTPRPRASAAADLTKAPVLEVSSQGASPKIRLSGTLPPGIVAKYQGVVNQVTSAPDPVGSFESSFEFVLVETTLDGGSSAPDSDSVHKNESNKAQGTKNGPTDDSARKAARDLAQAVPLRVFLENVRLSLPKRLHVDSALLEKRLRNISYLAKMLPDGTLAGFHVEGHLPKDITAPLEELGRSLNRLQPPTPKIAVGVGARWRVVSKFDAKGHLSLRHTDIAVTMTTDYHLSKWEQTKYGKAAVIDMTISVEGHNSSKAVPISAKGSGKGRLVLLVSAPILVSHKSTTTIKSQVQDKSSANTSVLDLRLSSLKHPTASVAPQKGKSRKPTRKSPK